MTSVTLHYLPIRRPRGWAVAARRVARGYDEKPTPDENEALPPIAPLRDLTRGVPILHYSNATRAIDFG